MPNKILLPEKFPHHVMLLFFPLRDEKQSCPPLHQSKLDEQGALDAVNRNKNKLSHMKI